MKSLNFEFLRPTCPELADLAGFAEAYAFNDPSSAMVKLRSFAERMVKRIYTHVGWQLPYDGGLNEWLCASQFKDAIPPTVQDRLHALRKHGNQAAHGGDVTARTAQWMAEEAHALAQWFFISFSGGSKEDCQAYQKPDLSVDSKAELKRERKEIKIKLAAQELEMAKLLEELEATRQKAVQAEKSKEDIQKALHQAQNAADVLKFDEATTRLKFIDEMIIEAGWSFEEKDGQGYAQRDEGEVIQDQPTRSGEGYADYILWDDNKKPLAVIEAKKIGHLPEKGRQQARMYADGLEKKYGQRPVIFYTNGIETRIWNDKVGEIPRPVYGIYSKDSLQRTVQRNLERKDLSTITIDTTIAGDEKHLYQREAIKRVSEHFQSKHRKALLVQATGTGKTRVAIALSKLLIQGGWVKRVLFLCDRKELRKQAIGAFKEFLSEEPRAVLSTKSVNDRSHNIFLATYPAMMKVFQKFDIGFFDLIIADESHRSIYNRYKPLFDYFDSLQVGLTATPVKFLTRNTYQLFKTEDSKPTFCYTYPEAINDSPPSLVPFKVIKHTTKFLRKGIKYKELSEEQQREADEQGLDSENLDYSKEQVDKQVFNKDTDRKILRNLMENGIKKTDGQTLGKTIVFARNHNHAVVLHQLFEEIYPQYGGRFCAVIDNYIDRAEQLIDDFKDKENELTIAISVDMLDTGIDVPEVVNLVFAKPVKSYVKFWQMIGRGTRLCKDLFGFGKNKQHFQIFDHWGNFEYFEETYREQEPSQSKSLMQQVLEARIDVAETALAQQKVVEFDQALELIQKDIASLPEKTIAVKEKWRQKRQMEQIEKLRQFDAAIKATLRQELAPLMTWVDIKGHVPAHRFDLLMAQLQDACLKQNSTFEDLKAELQDKVQHLPAQLNQVRDKIHLIQQIRGKEFWKDVSMADLEEVRVNLRSLMQFLPKVSYVQPDPLMIDIHDAAEEVEVYHTKLEGLELQAYRVEVKDILDTLFEEDSALQKIKQGKGVSRDELEDLASKVQIRDPKLKLEDLLVHCPNKENRLDLAIRTIIGMDIDAIEKHIGAFIEKVNPNAHQTRFLNLLKNHIARYGAIELELLYEEPFTTVDEEGVSGVFPEEQVDELLDLLTKLNTAKVED
ncbi:MAG: DEAD/DEAH box helicase family protein [Desulfamplus sp.]|nr:DEAD/DEAH box helicase family protein [Desulfamplus sp.]